ncbi:EAL domain-containing protein [Paraburkholderia lycopersici]|uniref:cyclic-guanylate-specific phosphodiesterase n=1 Tax=Paraburkholderia lycopersici TaxID=416944 RepID=A0A1G7BNX8_9BURK|nr:EAL domain-containing protein [Paraburkholderia lycopersici]SDE28871.1 EAL domain, c-di-GMP-specific phosphodiesterase class I (or its enzymatically inactive variant) [Paraburkholderia lycopersici]
MPRQAYRSPVRKRRLSGLIPTLGLIVTFVCAASLLLFAIAAGIREGDRSIRRREALIAHDMVSAIEHILDSVRGAQGAALAALAGQPCERVARRFAELRTHVNYVRGINLVANGRLYCSSAFGPYELPLAPFFPHVPAGIAINLIGGSPWQPHVPVMPLYVPAGENLGLLYVIESAYLTDALAHGVRYGAGRVTLSVPGAAALDDRGALLAADGPASRAGARATSSRWGFSVDVVFAPPAYQAARWKSGLRFGAAALLVDLLVGAAWLIAFAPRRLLLSAVRRGLRHGQFHVVYQPVVELATGRVGGVEALVRWTHPKFGEVSPDVFMADVEGSGLLGPLTRFVLERATTEMVRATTVRPFHLAVNVAPMDLDRKDFVADVLRAVDRLPPGVNLILEVTERFLLEKRARTDAIFEALKARGVKFAIDDFGTHHSNLDLLGQFPFDYVKIDGQFVRQLDKRGDQLVKGIVAMASHFEMAIIAEGVETEAQHEMLCRLGIPYAQGYFYRRPGTAGSIADMQRDASLVRYALSSPIR